MLTLIVLAVNLILLVALWPFPEHRIHIYTLLALFDLFFYLIQMFRFFRHVKCDESRNGFTFQFVVLQTFLVCSLFLFKLTELLIAQNCC